MNPNSGVSFPRTRFTKLEINVLDIYEWFIFVNQGRKKKNWRAKKKKSV